MRYIFVLLVLAMFSLSAFGQTLPPGSANVNLYFPQLADGGDTSARWQTTFIFNNPDDSTNATVELLLLDNEGNFLFIDFGAGGDFYHSFTLAPRATKVLRSVSRSTTMVVGWAIAESSIPVQATLFYRLFVNGTPTVEVAAPPALQTTRYSAPANRLSGIALANRYTSGPIEVDLVFFDSQGRQIANPETIPVPALGHRSKMLFEIFPTLTEEMGTVVMTAHDSTSPFDDQFIGYVISSDSAGIWSSLPSGAISFPFSHRERIQLVYSNVLNVALKNNYLNSSPQLIITGEYTINARAYTNNSTIEISLGLSQLLAEADSELANVVGHELGHMIQHVSGNQFVFFNKELDADIWGMLLALGAGYDPYGAGGALGKLMMVSGSTGLITQFEQDIFDPHTSFSSRMGNLYQSFTDACNLNPLIKTLCNNYKNKVHPNFPNSAPLIKKDSGIIRK